ncbi:hypothetical protein UNDYM_0559 [Undibacterium sp. YM2]|nr:hypothetical protein UNDYM_0559 [Undibacterium sp. YM2]
MRQFFKSILVALSLSLLAQSSAFAAEHATAQEAIDMIKKVVTYYKANGPEKTYAAVNDPKGQFIYKDLYVFAGTVKPGGVTLAHGGNPKLLGKPLGNCVMVMVFSSSKKSMKWQPAKRAKAGSITNGQTL